MSIKYTVQKNALKPGTYYPRPYAITTRGLAELVRDIAEATTVSEPDVEAVITALRRQIINGLADGDRVSIDGLVDFRVRLAQVLQSGADEFDPQSGGMLRVGATIKSSLAAELRQLARFEKLETGTKIPLPRSLFNSATKTAGAYTPGGIGELAGKNLRISDEQDEDEGVFFIALGDGSEIRVTDLHRNGDRRLIFLIPPELDGPQRLQVRTRYTEEGRLRVGELEDELIEA